MRKTAATMTVVLAFLAASCLVSDRPASGADVADDTWATKATLLTARSDLGVAVVNGKIYAIGGYPNYSNNEEYDPATDTWITKAPMPTGRYNFGIAVYENKIYCIGGQFNPHTENPYAGPEFTGAVEVYDPKTDKWENKNPMANPRAQFEANIVNDRIYLNGGRTGGQYSTVSLNEVYDPETESWTMKAAMPYPVVSYASAAVESKIYVFNGQDEFNKTMNLSVTQIYDTETDTWSYGKPLPTSVWRSAACVTSGVSAPQRVYIIGGQPNNGGGATSATQIYDPLSDNWSAGASMPTARFDLALGVIDDTVFAIGGTDHYIFTNEEANSENEMYKPIGYGTPDNEPEPFPVLPATAAVAVAATAGVLLYNRKRKRQRPRASLPLEGC